MQSKLLEFEFTQVGPIRCPRPRCAEDGKGGRLFTIRHLAGFLSVRALDLASSPTSHHWVAHFFLPQELLSAGGGERSRQ